MSRSRFVLCVVMVAVVLTGFFAAPARADGGWANQPRLGLARIGHDTAVAAGRVFAFGGFGPTFDDAEFFDSVEARQVGGDPRWRPKRPMPTARSNAAAAVVGGEIYVMGGVAFADVLDVVERFNPRTGKWSTLPPMPIARGAAGAAVLGSRLYIAGGFTVDTDATDSMLTYDARTRTWTSVASMPTARAFIRLVAVDGYLFAIGGRNADGNTVATVERYNARTNTWTTVEPMSTDRGAPGVTVAHVGHRTVIVVVGGARNVDFQPAALRRTTEVYDPRADRWRTIPALLPHGRASLTAVEVSRGRILAIGGAIDVNGVETATAEVNSLLI
jgi:hypothetical protein